jgi:hypothetical protein
MVRRYHTALEAVTGEALPRDPSHNGRLVNDEQLAILERARAIVRENPSTSAEDAIRATLGLVTVATAPAVPNSEVLALLLAEIQGVRQALEAQNERMVALEASIVSREALPAPQEAGQEDYVARLEQLHAEADKRAQYAMEELRRRDETVQPKRRGWWPWGGKERTS